MPMPAKGQQATLHAASDVARLVLEVDRVEKVFGSTDADSVRALAPTSFEVRANWKAIVLIGFSLLGDALNDALDPRRERA